MIGTYEEQLSGEVFEYFEYYISVILKLVEVGCFVVGYFGFGCLCGLDALLA